MNERTNIPVEIAEMAAVSKALVQIERVGDWLAGACVGSSLTLLTLGSLWMLFFMALLASLTLMTAAARWYARRRIRQLDEALGESETP